MTVTASIALTMLTFLGVEVEEGSDPNALLDDALGECNLTADQFVTEDTLFAMGYHRGLRAAAFDESEVPKSGDGADATLMAALEDGYGYGLEARDVSLTPPPSLVFEAHKSGVLKPGAMQSWAAGLDLSSGHRLAQSITVGSGKTAATIPAGTPVDILTELDDAYIVLYDGAALRLPNPTDAPSLVSADNRVAPERKTRARKTKESGTTTDGTAKEPKERKERGPTLKDAIIHVLERKDGGPGPLQSNGSFANRVLRRARELGIADKASKFVQQADRHVPYYLNCYKPENDGTVGRLGVEAPYVGTVARIEARRYFLKGDGLDEAARTAQVPEEIRAKFDVEGTMATKPIEKPVKPAAAEA
jgi:hypothetical protein